MTSLGLVEATEEEINAFIEYWNKPRVYYYPYDKLYEHRVIAVPVQKKELKDIIPYNPETREWPDIPAGYDFTMIWDEKKQKWKENIK